MRLTDVFLPSLLVTILQTSVLCAKCPRIRLENGRVKLRARGKMAYFKCRKRFTRLGDKFAVCLQTGTWSHSAPLCIARGCPSVGDLPNMDITISYDGAMLKFQCPIGTKRMGPEAITCNGRVWSDSPPSCETGLTLSCDFEKEGLCGWSQDESDNFDWTRKSGQTPTMSTGPQGDHTTGSGYYMFIESSSPRKAGDVARLISPTYPSTLKYRCFEFWYHMKGPDEENAVGSLEVYIQPESASIQDIDPEFYVDGNHGDNWQRGFVKIPDQDEHFKIVIVGKRKDAFVSDIALDDLRIYNCSEESTTTSTTLAVTTTSVRTTATSATTVMASRKTAVVTDPATSTVSDKTTSAASTTATSSTGRLSTSTRRVSKTTKTYVTTMMVKTRRPTRPPKTRRTTSSTIKVTKPLPTTVTPSPTSKRKTTSVTKRPFFTKRVRTTLATTPRRVKVRTTTSVPMMTSASTVAVTTAHNYSNLATDVMEVTPSPEPEGEGYFNTTRVHSDNATRTRMNATSSPFSGTMDNDINTPPTSTVNSSWTTTDLPNFIPTVKVDTGKRPRGNASPSIMPLVIGITAGIVVGAIVIGILAWLWARSQRKKKEREAAEDEMYIVSTGEAAAYSYK